jgi:hypothetical protein
MDRGVKSCIYCHHDINETAQGFNEGCRAIASSIKSWRGFIDIMMTEYTRFYSTIHLISKSASRFGHLNILIWLSLKIYKLSHFILSSICNYTIYAIILTRPINPNIQRVVSCTPSFNIELLINPFFCSPLTVFACSAIRFLITRTSVLVQPLYNFKLS